MPSATINSWPLHEDRVDETCQGIQAEAALPKCKLCLSVLSRYSTASMDAFLQMPSYCIAPDWQFVSGLANFAQRRFAMKQKMLGSRR
ncbi:hypothetical protein DJFAAGMI_01465 [Comamonas sp. PE63]|uniref:Uncharacterized protein n=1 Tax=Comamonas brasiliensis TaxID=1812482 RepID=A0ABS5LQF9_9BURK|nr:hypothetical protein [Comamonas sp. PE63]